MRLSKSLRVVIVALEEFKGMKTRIITGLVAGALLFGILLLPPLVAYCGFALVCVLAVWEMFSVLGINKDRVLTILSLIFAAAMPFVGWFQSTPLFCLVLAVYGMLLGVCQLLHRRTRKVHTTMVTFFMTLILSLGISCTVYCRRVDAFGLLYMLMVLLIAWGSDTGAYFVGSFFGKHKLCPTISPKKTVEGFFGGWVCGVVCALLIAWLWDVAFLPTNVTVAYGKIAVLAFVLSPLSVLGDLFASVVKRRVGAKDYGHIMPGHGGMMDRFDSLLFVAPLFLAALQIMSIVQGV